jgi:hypothetical protein
MPMTIVHAQPPKRQRRPKAPEPALTTAIVTTRKRGSKPPPELPDDAEADARVKAWFVRNVRRGPGRQTAGAAVAVSAQ